MPPSPSAPPRLKHRFIDTYLAWGKLRPKSLLLALALFTVALGALAPRLKVDPRLEALLPPNTATSAANEEAKRRYAGVSPYYLVVQSADAELNRQIAERALEEVRKWPETLWALNRRDPSYFLDRRLLYVDKKTLDALAEDVEIFLDWHRCAQMPGCVNFEDEPPEPDFEPIRKHYDEMPELSALVSLFGKENVPDPEESLEEEGEGDEEAKDTTAAARPKRNLQPHRDRFGELCRPDGGACVVQAVLNGDASDLEFASEMLHRGEALLESLEPPEKPSDLITAVTGVYRSLPMTREAVMRDLKTTFGLTLVLVVGVLALQFRRGRAFLLLLVPLFVGTIWSLGVFALVSPTLNLISSAVLIVLAGLGIDFSLHLITHFGSQRERGLSAPDALRSTLDHLLSSLWVAALTTGCGFLALLAGRFRGFSQMGYLAAIGIACILLATLLVMPPLILWLDQRRPLTESLTRAWKPPALLSARWQRGPAWAVTILGVMLLAFGLWQARQLELEYDFKRLVMQAAGDHGTDFGPALHGTSRGAVLMLADDPEALEQAGRGVRESYPEGLRGSEGASVVTPGTFVPPAQEERLASIARLRELAEDAKRHAKGRLERRLEAWRPLLEVESPIRVEEMPTWVLDSFAERDRSFGTVGVIYHSYASDDARQMMALTEQLGELRATYPKVRFASSHAVLGEVIPLLSGDGFLVTGLALGGLVIGTLLIGHSIRRTLLVVTSVCMAVAATTACMVLFGWKVDMYNLLVFPVAFGIGVDGAIYVVWSVYKRGGITEWSGLPVSSRAVIGSTLTTLVAFGSLVISENGGLTSLGKLAVVALAITLVTNLVWLPAVLSLVSDLRSGGEKGRSAPPPQAALANVPSRAPQAEEVQETS